MEDSFFQRSLARTGQGSVQVKQDRFREKHVCHMRWAKSIWHYLIFIRELAKETVKVLSVETWKDDIM